MTKSPEKKREKGTYCILNMGVLMPNGTHALALADQDEERLWFWSWSPSRSVHWTATSYTYFKTMHVCNCKCTLEMIEQGVNYDIHNLGELLCSL